MMLRFAIAAALALVASGATADEIWSSNIGEVYYADEIGDTAIFGYTGHDGEEVRFYVPGLAGNYDNRGTYGGYWIGPTAGECLAELGGPDGRVSTNWGSLTIVFTEPAFPSGWVMMRGLCFGPQEHPVVAKPWMEGDDTKN
jgi:hypothetical protein